MKNIIKNKRITSITQAIYTQHTPKDYNLKFNKSINPKKKNKQSSHPIKLWKMTTLGCRSYLHPIESLIISFMSNDHEAGVWH